MEVDRTMMMMTGRTSLSDVVPASRLVVAGENHKAEATGWGTHSWDG
jgi:hypothetical protein